MVVKYNIEKMPPISTEVALHPLADVSQAVQRGRLRLVGDANTITGSAKLWSFKEKRQGSLWVWQLELVSPSSNIRPFPGC